MKAFDTDFPTPVDDVPEVGLYGFAERGWLPDVVFRHAMRRFCAGRVRAQASGGPTASAATRRTHIEASRGDDLAIAPPWPNDSHERLAEAFFAQGLGPGLGYYLSGRETLAEAEDSMLELYGARAELGDHQSILDLGCGWGSLTLWMARRYPGASITAVSDSRAQCAHVEARCMEEGFGHVRVVHADIEAFMPRREAYDRVVAIDLLERVSNYRAFLARIAPWLRPGGKLLVQILAHRHSFYETAPSADDGWMVRHGFIGGRVPSVDTLLWFQDDLEVDRRWHVNGSHCRRTANHRLARQDAARVEIMASLRAAYDGAADVWYRRWRMAWMTLAERYGYARGTEWMAVHYRFVRPDPWDDRLMPKL